MVSYADIAHDSRVQREADTLARAGHEVAVYCLSVPDGGVPGLHERVRLVAVATRPGGVVPGAPSPFRTAARRSRPRRLADRVGWLVDYGRTLLDWGGRVARVAGSVDAWHAHDFTGALAVARQAGRARFVYDVHDLFLEAGIGGRLPGPARRAIAWYEGRLVRRATAVITVNRALAAVVARRYSRPDIVVVHNCPARYDVPEPRPDRIRPAAGIAADAPVVLYHGALGPGRGIERVCEALLQPGLERYHAALLGYGIWSDEVRALAAEPRFGGRVHVLPAVAPSELLPWVASADVGVMAFPHDTLNVYLSTPNKLFECLAAGTPAVVSDFPGMRAIVLDDSHAPLGAVCDPTDVDSVARAIVSIVGAGPSDREAMRRRCAQAAHERWNWETESRALLGLYDAAGSGVADPATATAG